MKRLVLLTFMVALAYAVPMASAQSRPLPVTPLYKQEQIETHAFSFTRTPSAFPPTRIGASDPIIIRARYYNKSGDGAILILNFLDEVENLNIRIPVALFEPKDVAGKDLILYGPQFYDGRKALKIVPEILVLKSETFKKYKELFNGYLKEAVDLIPVIGQASKFVDIGWNTAEKFYGKNETETFQPIILSRDSNQPLGTSERWYLLANRDALEKIPQDMSFSAPGGQDNLPALPDGVSIGGRVVFVSITRSERAISFSRMSERTEAFFQNTKSRLDRAGLKLDNPYTAEGVESDLIIRRNFEVFLSMMELAREIASAPGNSQTVTTEEAVRTLFETFKVGQLNLDTGALPKLSVVKDQQVSTLLTRIFEYRDLSGSLVAGQREEPGLHSIIAWYNWLDKRLKKISTEPNGEPTIVFDDLKARGTVLTPVGVYPFAKAYPRYAVSYLFGLWPSSASVSAQNTISQRLSIMRENIKRMREIRRIFHSTELEPWLRFEQRAVALWLTAHLQGLPADLPTADFRSEDEVSNFADRLDDFLSTAKVLEPVENQDNKWRFGTLTNYITSAFFADLKRINSESTILDKHQAIVDSYSKIVETSVKVLSQEEQDAVGKAIAEKFPTDLNGKNFSFSSGYFEKTILIFSPSAPETKVISAERTEDLFRLISEVQSLTSNDVKSLSSVFTIPASSLNNKRRDALVRVFNLFRSGTVSFSLSSKAIQFISKMVDDKTLSNLPSTQATLDSWIGAATTRLPNIRWNDAKRQFDSFDSDPLLNEVKDIETQLSEGCDRSSSNSMRNCSEEPLRAKELIQRLYETVCDKENISVTVRNRSLEVLKKFVDVPESTLNDATNKCQLYKTQYPLDRLEWKQGIYRLRP